MLASRPGLSDSFTFVNKPLSLFNDVRDRDANGTFQKHYIDPTFNNIDVTSL